MNILWVAFYLLIALFVAAVVMKAVKRAGNRQPAGPFRSSEQHTAEDRSATRRRRDAATSQE